MRAIQHVSECMCACVLCMRVNRATKIRAIQFVQMKRQICDVFVSDNTFELFKFVTVFGGMRDNSDLFRLLLSVCALVLVLLYFRSSVHFWIGCDRRRRRIDFDTPIIFKYILFAVRRLFPSIPWDKVNETVQNAINWIKHPSEMSELNEKRRRGMKGIYVYRRRLANCVCVWARKWPVSNLSVCECGVVFGINYYNFVCLLLANV